ncbi:PREDICTED: WD repeat-containing protein 25 [Cyprinodon variegatus]|uniref:WD repeat domain 25 n=1 Tax=Cyprinodon variegatus TaxID=28743 RepID=A0A3Q2E8I3_CYPVA|nr:PREDICTED: WD repeat-containing protein 25 [Cyprinodon variegatus]
MSSLVAYDDSESEEEPSPQVDGGAAATFHTDPAGFSSPNLTPSHSGSLSKQTTIEHHRWVTEQSSSSSLVHPKHEHWDTEYYSERKDRHFTDSSAAIGFPANQRKTGPVQPPLCLPKCVTDASNPAKRQHSAMSGIRPYIPKRQRLIQSEEADGTQNPSEQVSGNQTRKGPVLTDVSSRVKHYLGEKTQAAGVPRKLLMSLEGHQGPVNTVQWCPVPHISHLLLSASMDKTFKVWDGAESGRCLRLYTCHSGAVRDACWTPCGQQLLTGSFDNTAVITDVETGQPTVKVDNQFKVMCVAVHPSSPDVFLCGGYSSVVKAWDSRCCKAVKAYKAAIQQTLDILFLSGGSDFITSSDCVSRDSADRTLIAWDYHSTAKISNQIYHERYTCPSLALHPLEESFVGQTNGNYIALFSSQMPYRMNKRRRFDGHKVEGYAVQCDFSMDGSILASGSSTGTAHFYDYQSTRVLHALQAHRQPCLSVSQHPVLPATAATCDWAGEIKIWN